MNQYIDCLLHSANILNEFLVFIFVFSRFKDLIVVNKKIKFINTRMVDIFIIY